MARFLIRRILQGIIVLWLITVGVFAIFFIGPGAKQVPRVLAGKNATPQVIEQVTKRLQLDRPIYVQYWHFVWLLLHGNLGYSFYHGQSVNSVLKAAFPITLSLVIGAAIIWVVLGVLSGVLSAVKSRTVADRRLHRAGPVLLLDADVRARAAAAPDLLLRAHHPRHPRVPGHVHPVQPEPDRVVPLADPALVHAGPGVGRDLHPADPGVDAGRDERGLHPHRPGQGAVRAAGHLPALAAGGADPDRHPVRPGRGHPARRRGHHRGRVLDAGPRVHRGGSPSPSRTCR